MELNRGDIGVASYPNSTDWLFPSLDSIYYSIGKNGVAYGDMNWTQSDLYFMKGSDVTKLVAEKKAKKEIGVLWSTETINGKTVDVERFPLDENGQVTKGGTGGANYYFSWKEGKGFNQNPYDLGLIIAKQAKGD